jgi:tetratricopeptide (TPR) repeat protein
VQEGDRWLDWPGIASLLALLLLWHLCAVTTQRPLLWLGSALAAAGLGAWTASWTLAVLGATSIPMRLASRLLVDPTDPMAVLGVQMLGGLARAVHARISRIELALAGVGLLLALARLAIPGRVRRRTWLGAARVAIVALALGALLWAQYVTLGQRIVAQAGKAHRAGEIVEALSLYRALDRTYPLPVRGLPRVWQDLQECERYHAAVAAHEAADHASAARQFEALLVGNPAIAVRERAETTLVISLTAWATSLREAGERERALDRYRYVRDAFRERDVQQRIAEVYLEWGDALLAQGDYQGGIATYGRIAYDVSHPRLWRDADEQRIGAYCAWQASLRQDGDVAGAQRVCAELLALYPAATEACGACGP